ncbi:MAG: adenine phosphoribosyltransferase [Pseudomonadales bacterium]|jgi:adenine phosphoribosyltransferase|nr:adenine phosphoribosyltransferase [Pseudomonadales bacterium]
MNLTEKIRTVPNWPIEGVMFRDITTVLQEPTAFRTSIDLLYARYKGMQIDKIAAIDARGFLFGSVLAYKLEVGLILIRKKGKLPFKTISAEYDLEYGTDTVEVHSDAIKAGEKVLIVDDLIATGGTVSAATKLVERLGGQIIECAFLVELPDLKGRERIDGYSVFSLTEFQGD